MSYLPVISGDECVKALQKIGFNLKCQRGSNIILRRDNPFCQVVVPNHKTIDRGTLTGILKTVGISVDYLKSLL